MNRRKLIGLVTLMSSIFLLAFYTYLLFFTRLEVQLLILKLSIFIIVILILTMFIIIGFSLLKSPLAPFRIDPNSENELSCREHRNQ
ncbi:MAG: hypothetical protein QXE81_02510 [Desulfurococcaceae archaeon]